MVILVEALELFELFLGEDLVEVLYAVNSVVEQCFLSLEYACLGSSNLLFVIAVECFVQSLFSILLLLAEFLKCGIHYDALLIECCSLFVRDLENGIHEFRTRAFLEVELLVEIFAFLEVFVRTFRAAIAEVFVMEAFTMEFAVVLAMMHTATLAAVARAVVLGTVMVFAATGALFMRWRAGGLLGTACSAEAAVCKAEGANGKSERASEYNQACEEGLGGSVHYLVSCNK